MNLVKRKITPNGACELCGHDEETICHLLWFCDHTKEVWNASKFASPFEISTRWNFLDVVENLQRCEHTWPGLMEQFIAVCWGIWKNRNDLWTGGKGKAGRVILRNAMHLVEEFQVANESKAEDRVDPTPLVPWQLPSHECYKVNTDRAVFSNRKQAGSGVIIWDGAGEVIAALFKKQKCLLGAVEAEAKALEVGVNFARDMGIRDVEFESDSLVTYNALQGLVSLPSLVENVLVGIMNQALLFRKLKFSHIKQQGNVPAHLLAQHANNVDDYIVWLEECPSLIEHVFAQDRNVVTHF